MDAKIFMDNAQSKVECHPALLSRLRHLVSFRQEVLPPVAVQRLIREVFRTQSSTSRAQNYQRLLSSRRAQVLAEEIGFQLETLTPRSVEAVLNQNGEWDGWTTLISATGTFGSGLLPHVKRALSLRLQVPFTVQDLRVVPSPSTRELGFQPPLFPFQAEARDAFLEAGRGVIALPPRSGKTRTACAIIQALRLRTLYVVPTKGLVAQTVQALSEFLDPDEVVGITGGKPNRKMQAVMQRARVWVVTPPTAAGGVRKRQGAGSRTPLPGIVGIDTRQLLIIDEFHHSSAPTYQSISNAARNAYYRLGMTGTHFRSDGRDMQMHSVISSVVYEKSIKDMVEIGRLVPSHIAMVRVPDASVPEYLGGHDLKRRGITESEKRNGLAAWLAWQMAELGKKVLVITQEVEHSKDVAARIPQSWQVDGADSDQVDRALKALQDGRVKVVVGTSVIGEGRDVPAADVLVYLPAVRSPVKVMQDTMRPLTASPGKKFALVLDFADQHHESLMEKAAERLALYRSEDAFEATVLDPEQVLGWVASVHTRYGMSLGSGADAA